MFVFFSHVFSCLRCYIEFETFVYTKNLFLTYSCIYVVFVLFFVSCHFFSYIFVLCPTLSSLVTVEWRHTIDMGLQLSGGIRLNVGLQPSEGKLLNVGLQPSGGCNCRVTC